MIFAFKANMTPEEMLFHLVALQETNKRASVRASKEKPMTNSIADMIQIGFDYMEGQLSLDEAVNEMRASGADEETLRTRCTPRSMFADFMSMGGRMRPNADNSTYFNAVTAYMMAKLAQKKH